MVNRLAKIQRKAKKILHSDKKKFLTEHEHKLIQKQSAVNTHNMGKEYLLKTLNLQLKQVKGRLHRSLIHQSLPKVDIYKKWKKNIANILNTKSKN